MRLLVYGFGPYRKFHHNVTEKILRKLPKRPGMKKIIFPVTFHKRQFINAVKRFDPDIIVGLGQCSRGQRLRIETRAVNRKRNSIEEKAKPIVAGGRRRLRTNLKLSLGRYGRISSDAGDYVCNFSIYVILDFLRRHRRSIRFGFIHIPHDHDPNKVIRALKIVVDRIGREI